MGNEQPDPFRLSIAVEHVGDAGPRLVVTLYVGGRKEASDYIWLRDLQMEMEDL